jgi:SprT-like family
MKKPLALALSLSLAASCVAKPIKKRTFEDYTRDMYSDYADVNEQYFLGQLPAEIHIQFVDYLTNDQGVPLMGWTLCIADHCTIKLDKKQNPNERVAEFTLYHEMCHIDTLGKDLDIHGPKFQSCMLDLASRGLFHDLW